MLGFHAVLAALACRRVVRGAGGLLSVRPAAGAGGQEACGSEGEGGGEGGGSELLQGEGEGEGEGQQRPPPFPPSTTTTIRSPLRGAIDGGVALGSADGRGSGSGSGSGSPHPAPPAQPAAQPAAWGGADLPASLAHARALAARTPYCSVAMVADAAAALARDELPEAWGYTWRAVEPGQGGGSVGRGGGGGGAGPLLLQCVAPPGAAPGDPRDDFAAYLRQWALHCSCAGYPVCEGQVQALARGVARGDAGVVRAAMAGAARGELPAAWGYRLLSGGAPGGEGGGAVCVAPSGAVAEDPRSDFQGYLRLWVAHSGAAQWGPGE